MKKNVKKTWFITKPLHTLTEEEKQTQQLREEFYQLAVHYVLQSNAPTVSASAIKRLYVPMHVGDWKMSPNYEAAKEVLERMVQENILHKVKKTLAGVSDLYFYEVLKKPTPFALSKNLQQVLSEIQRQEEKKLLPGKKLQESILSWVKEETGQSTIEAPFEVRFIEADGENYRYVLFKHDLFFASKIFDVRQLMKEKKLA